MKLFSALTIIAALALAIATQAKADPATYASIKKLSLLSATQTTVSQSTKAETVSPETREIATSTFALTGDVLRSLGQTSLSRALPDEFITDQQVERLSKQVASRCEALRKVSPQGEDGIYASLYREIGEGLKWHDSVEQKQLFAMERAEIWVLALKACPEEFSFQH